MTLRPYRVLVSLFLAEFQLKFQWLKDFLKDRFTLKYSDASNLLVCATNVVFDKAAPVTQLARITASAWRLKTDFAKANPTVGIANLKIKKKKFHPHPHFEKNKIG